MHTCDSAPAHTHTHYMPMHMSHKCDTHTHTPTHYMHLHVSHADVTHVPHPHPHTHYMHIHVSHTGVTRVLHLDGHTCAHHTHIHISHANVTHTLYLHTYTLHTHTHIAHRCDMYIHMDMGPKDQGMAVPGSQAPPAGAALPTPLPVHDEEDAHGREASPAG